MTDPTPGRWTHHQHDKGAYTILGKGSALVADVNDCSPADARLIAAAPALLDACRQTLDLSQHADGCKWFDVPLREMETPAGRAKADARCDCHIRVCKAALALVLAP